MTKLRARNEIHNIRASNEIHTSSVWLALSASRLPTSFESFLFDHALRALSAFGTLLCLFVCFLRQLDPWVFCFGIFGVRFGSCELR